ncbi:MAG: alpha/beta fold hydrolase, partial [Candidatus Hydrogenedentes bacterium]|nr:alpha/beta fold hydrolase [Candidatus Hydrogenedentota bacterium]
VDLRGCRSSEAPFERTRDNVCMEDFFKEDIPATIAHILKTTNYEKVHWVGHSMGGMLLYAYALHFGGNDIASGTTLGSPIDFSDAAGKVPKLPLAFAEKFPVISGNFIRGIVPILRLLRVSSFAFPINQKNLLPKINAGHFINMLEDPLPALMGQLHQWMRTREYILLDGELDVPNSIHALSVPLFAFFAVRDPFINIERAKTWFGSIENADKKMEVCSKAEGYVEDYSHCDLAFSRESVKEVFEPINQWLETHASPVRASIQEEVERFSASTISENKRAHILSGNAYAHITDVETTKPKIEDEDKEKKEAHNVAVAAPPSPKSVAKKKAVTNKVPVKKAAVKKPAVKKAPVKKAPVKKAPVKKAPVKKAPVKKPAVKKP